MRRGVALALAGLALGLLLAHSERWLAGGREPRAPEATATGLAAAAPAAPAPRVILPAASAGAGGDLPASLAGSQVDGALLADAEGRFVPTPSALHLFDYFLSATGEEDPEAIRARIEREIERQLPAGARDGARALLERHLAFREAARALHAEGLGAADLDTRHQRLRELRREHYGGAAAEALFGEEEAVDRVALALRRVEQDPALSDEARTARREALLEELPPAVREARRQATLPLELARREDALRAEGATPGQVRALREALVGPEAADRLAALDARRARWNERVESWRAARDALLGGEPGAEPAQLEAELERMRAEHFAPDELARVRALDRMDGVP
jgi:lipase chaperone LimK